MKLTQLVLLVLGTATVISCTKTKDSDLIGDAQYCLDTATAATVQTCVDKVAGLESSGAYIIRCSANFIENGFGSSQQIVESFESLDGSGSGSTTGFLSALNFDGDTAEASETFTNCSRTNQKGLSMLAAMVKSATYIAHLGGLAANASPADLATAINNLKNDPNATTVVGETITAVYQTTCQTGSQVNTTLCGQISDAITQVGTDPEALGEALLTAWKDL